MPLYGRGFTLNSVTKNGLYAPASNPIPAGPFTREAGFWGYNEVRSTFCCVFERRFTFPLISDLRQHRSGRMDHRGRSLLPVSVHVQGQPVDGLR